VKLLSLLVFLLSFFTTQPLAFSNPLNLDLTKLYKLPPEISKFKYWYGDVDYGIIIYTGAEDISGFETELQLSFRGKKISSALVILGPAGLNSDNCIRKYKKVTKLLNSKYGHYTHISETKDPIMDDLITSIACDPVSMGIYSLKTYWKLKNFAIISLLTADEDGFYIEIEYIFMKVKNKSIQKLKKIL